MLLTLDVGNSQIFGGVFRDKEILFRFRKNSKAGLSSDEIGIFLRDVLRENLIEPKKVKHVAICSVVPDLVHSLRNASKKYFNVDPYFVQVGTKTGLKIAYYNPGELGADRISNAIAISHMFPQKNAIVIDLGTATKFCVISAKKEYLGGVIVAGLRLCMEALESKTAKLPSVEIIDKTTALGRSTVEGIQSGLFFGHLGTIKEISSRLSEECFGSERPLIVGTGGFSSLFEKSKVFDLIQPDLVLQGLYFAHKMNHSETHRKETA